MKSSIPKESKGKLARFLVEAVKYVFHGHVVKETPRLAAKGDTMAVFQLANLHVLAIAYVFLS